MRSSFFYKLREAIFLVLHEGMGGLMQKCIRYVRHKIKDQWEFVYFAFSLSEEVFLIKNQEAIVVREAIREDIPRMEYDLFPFISVNEENDKRYIALIGKEGVRCFVGEKDDRIVHYCWVFEDAVASPILDTPFDRRKIQKGDAYIGPAFTSPQVRGSWIFPYSISTILIYLKNRTEVKRVLLFVHKDNPGAVAFFKRLGFTKIENAYGQGLFARIARSIGYNTL